MRTVLTLHTLGCHRLQAVPMEKADQKDIYQVGGIGGAFSVLRKKVGPLAWRLAAALSCCVLVCTGHVPSLTPPHPFTPPLQCPVYFTESRFRQEVFTATLRSKQSSVRCKSGKGGVATWVIGRGLRLVPSCHQRKCLPCTRLLTYLCPACSLTCRVDRGRVHVPGRLLGGAWLLLPGSSLQKPAIASLLFCPCLLSQCVLNRMQPKCKHTLRSSTLHSQKGWHLFMPGGCRLGWMGQGSYLGACCQAGG